MEGGGVGWVWGVCVGVSLNVAMCEKWSSLFVSERRILWPRGYRNLHTNWGAGRVY